MGYQSVGTIKFCICHLISCRLHETSDAGDGIDDDAIGGDCGCNDTRSFLALLLTNNGDGVDPVSSVNSGSTSVCGIVYSGDTINIHMYMYIYKGHLNGLFSHANNIIRWKMCI